MATTTGLISPSVRAAAFRALATPAVANATTADGAQNAATVQHGTQMNNPTTTTQITTALGQTVNASSAAAPTTASTLDIPLAMPTPNVADAEDLFQYFATPPVFADPFQTCEQGQLQATNEAAEANVYGEPACVAPNGIDPQTAKKATLEWDARTGERMPQRATHATGRHNAGNAICTDPPE